MPTPTPRRDRRHDRLQAIDDRERDRILGFRFAVLLRVVPDLERRRCPPEGRLRRQKGRVLRRDYDCAHLFIAFAAARNSINSRLMAVLKAFELVGRLSVTGITPSADR